MNIIPCMGGWCNSRNKCQHYHANDSKMEIVERLCGKEEEPESQYKSWISSRYIPVVRHEMG